MEGGKNDITRSSPFSNLTRRFGDFVAVDHINFEGEAKLLATLTFNGSGNTITIRMLLGCLTPSHPAKESAVLGNDQR